MAATTFCQCFSICFAPTARSAAEKPWGKRINLLLSPFNVPDWTVNFHSFQDGFRWLSGLRSFEPWESTNEQMNKWMEGLGSLIFFGGGGTPLQPQISTSKNINRSDSMMRSPMALYVLALPLLAYGFQTQVEGLGEIWMSWSLGTLRLWGYESKHVKSLEYEFNIKTIFFSSLVLKDTQMIPFLFHFSPSFFRTNATIFLSRECRWDSL